MLDDGLVWSGLTGLKGVLFRAGLTTYPSSFPLPFPLPVVFFLPISGSKTQGLKKNHTLGLSERETYSHAFIVEKKKPRTQKAGIILSGGKRNGLHGQSTLPAAVESRPCCLFCFMSAISLSFYYFFIYFFPFFFNLNTCVRTLTFKAFSFWPGLNGGHQ